MPPRLGKVPSLLRRVWPGLVASIFGFVALGAWALASPVGASPDEDFHLASIWCGGGERAGQCELPEGQGSGAKDRMVPDILVAQATCYAFRPDQSAGCQGAFDETTLVETSRGNFTGLYPGVFYAVMSTLVGPSVSASVVAMRLFNAAFFVLFVSAVTWLTPPHRRETVVLPVLATAVPLGMFLVASINPSGWAILSAATLWISLYNYFESSGKRRWLWAIFAAFALVIGAGARADAAAYACLAIVGVFILKARRDRRFWLGATLPLGLIIVAVLFYRMAGQSGAAVDGLNPSPESSGSLLGQFWQNIIMVPDLWVGMLGHWGLGWLDTAMPAVVWVSSFAVLASVIFYGLSRAGVRKYVALGLMLAAFWGVPALIQLQTRLPVGNYLQPRYILPIGVLLVAFALVAMRKTSWGLNVAQLVVVGSALTVANSLALQTNIRRYVTGVDVGGMDLNSHTEWWWTFGPSPLATWIIGTLAFGLCIGILAVLLYRTRVFAAPADANP